MLDDKTPWANVISFVFVLLVTFSVVVLGYFHGNMHLLTTLKNARNSVS
jgi:Tfp pilus assembly protein PilO|tara:strand:- start:779 stop:925 length:147 start_codon:yes stop_codon:yes gene_type:complete